MLPIGGFFIRDFRRLADIPRLASGRTWYRRRNGLHGLEDLAQIRRADRRATDHPQSAGYPRWS